MTKLTLKALKGARNSFEKLLDRYSWLKEQLEVERIFDLISQRMRTRVWSYREKEYNRAISDLVNHPVVQNEREHGHHLFFTRFDHMYSVSKIAFFYAHKLGVDPWKCARAGILHDCNARWYQTRKAVAFAKRLGECQDIQLAIKTHMLVPNLPVNREGWILVMADWTASSFDIYWNVRCVTKHVLFRIAYRLLFVYNLRHSFS
jgi:hypothetical protein